ncbi:MAG TPA: DUF2357 domain-containing protein [Telluria sp.]|nr:DUF2357 domain-containing protein [Telluria sp.]
MMTDASTCWQLHIASTLNPGETSIVRDTDDLPLSLRENYEYEIRIPSVPIHSLFIDDVELQPRRSAHGIYYRWSAGFFAGQVELLAVDKHGNERQFPVCVVPQASKLGIDQFKSMVERVRTFDASLLLGEAAATAEFGVGSSASVNNLVAYSRIKKFGKNFVQSLEALIKAPHQTLRSTYQQVPLSALRHIRPAQLTDRRLLAAALGLDVEADVNSLQFMASAAAPSFDTAANREMKMLLRRFQTTVRKLIVLIESGKFSPDKDEQEVRAQRRLDLLRSLDVSASNLMRRLPFSAVLRPATSSAGLTQIAASPTYSRAHRQGICMLRTGIYGDADATQINLSPSWGIYETWCFIHLLDQLQSELGTLQWRKVKSAAANAEMSLSTTLPCGTIVEALFQAKFNAEKPVDGRSAWSVSKERYPDFVLIARNRGTTRFMILDAKYRSGRGNVLDGMESAHIYRDSLRLDERRPDLCLLLLPGATDVPSLETPEFWRTHRVGAISEFSIDHDGVLKCVRLIQTWLSGSFTDS